MKNKTYRITTARNIDMLLVSEMLPNWAGMKHLYLPSNWVQTEPTTIIKKASRANNTSSPVSLSNQSVVRQAQLKIRRTETNGVK